jgi:hypothetical protein
MRNFDKILGTKTLLKRASRFFIEVIDRPQRSPSASRWTTGDYEIEFK